MEHFEEVCERHKGIWLCDSEKVKKSRYWTFANCSSYHRHMRIRDIQERCIFSTRGVRRVPRYIRLQVSTSARKLSGFRSRWIRMPRRIGSSIKAYSKRHFWSQREDESAATTTEGRARRWIWWRVMTCWLQSASRGSQEYMTSACVRDIWDWTY